MQMMQTLLKTDQVAKLNWSNVFFTLPVFLPFAKKTSCNMSYQYEQLLGNRNRHSSSEQMERQVSETVYSVFGITPILDAIDEEVVRPHIKHRYDMSPENTSPPPKMILITGSQGCGQTSLCSALVNELRRGRSNKRGDVHYKNRPVSYLEWDSRNPDSVLLTKIFEDAKNRDFTVLTMPNFERVCPSADTERVRGAAPSMKEFLKRGLDGIPNGKILVVAIAARESFCDAEMIGRMEYKYPLELPDSDARREIILGILEQEGAALTPPSLIDRLVYSTRLDYTVADLAYVVHGALRQARSRQRERQANGNIQQGFSVIAADWTRYLDVILEERLMDAREEEEELMIPIIGPINLEQNEDAPEGPPPQPDAGVQILRVIRLELHPPPGAAAVRNGEEAQNEALLEQPGPLPEMLDEEESTSGESRGDDSDDEDDWNDLGVEQVVRNGGNNNELADIIDRNNQDVIEEEDDDDF